MEIVHNEYHIPSATKRVKIYIQSFEPAKGNDIKGIISIVHGMAEHTDRYHDVGKYLCSKGYAVFMHDHAGHGKSINSDADLGFFCDKDGSECVVDDVKTVTDMEKKLYPGKKLILWGHSMGSFITRNFIAKYPDAADAAVICGTSGANPGAGPGIVIANLISKIKGPQHPSKFLNNIAFGSYNKKFDGNTGFEWLSANEENVKKYVADPKCGFLFTAGGFKDLFTLLKKANSKEWYESVKKDFPIYLISGEMDPVGNYGKGVKEVYDKLKASGHTNVQMKLYKGLRHEIHNEKTNLEVYADIASFADSIVK